MNSAASHQASSRKSSRSKQNARRKPLKNSPIDQETSSSEDEAAVEREPGAHGGVKTHVEGNVRHKFTRRPRTLEANPENTASSSESEELIDEGLTVEENFEKRAELVKAMCRLIGVLELIVHQGKMRQERNRVDCANQEALVTYVDHTTTEEEESASEEEEESASEDDIEETEDSASEHAST